MIYLQWKISMFGMIDYLSICLNAFKMTSLSYLVGWIKEVSLDDYMENCNWLARSIGEYMILYSLVRFIIFLM